MNDAFSQRIFLLVCFSAAGEDRIIAGHFTSAVCVPESGEDFKFFVAC